MFTGIIEETGSIKSVDKGRKSAALKIGAVKVLEGLHIGDSISVNGVCLTVVSFSNQEFSAEVMAETLRKSNLGQLKSGDKVNLERAMQMGDRLGGHLVSGHVDGVGLVKAAAKEDIAIVFTIEAPEEVLRYVINKGSIAIDGISLTVMDFNQTSFRVSIIPHTASQTTLGFKKPGDMVNLETDMIAKYVERLLGKKTGAGGIDENFLAQHGFR